MRRLKRLAKRKKGSNPILGLLKVSLPLFQREIIFTNLISERKILSSRPSSRRASKNIATRLFRFADLVRVIFSPNILVITKKILAKFGKVSNQLSLFALLLLPPTCINIDNSPVSDPSIIATSFNNYFVSIAENIRKEIPFTNKHFTNFLKNPVSDSLFFSPTDELEVFYCLSSLDLSKSSGPFIKTKLSVPLSNIINLSFTTGIFPTNLKTAKVIPVYKKGSKLEVNNCRPISLLSNIDKVFEKLIYKRVYRFLEDKKVLFSHQFGFRKNYSTSQTLLNISKKVWMLLIKETLHAAFLLISGRPLTLLIMKYF